MKKILGLDLGTNSIGWALIEEENNLLQKILDCGCRIIPEKDEHRDFELGNEISKNAKRRGYRSKRRLNERYKLRRNNLIKLCNIIGIVPSGLEALFEKIALDKKIVFPEKIFTKGDKQYKPHELYELRVKALNEKVTLNELFRIIYHLNQRRGFKSNKKVSQENDGQNEIMVDEIKRKSEVTIEKVKIIKVEPTGEKVGRLKRDELKVILDDGRTSVTDKYIFKKLAGENVILEIKKEFLKSSPEPKYTFTIPSQWKKNRKELNDAIKADGGFPSKYFYNEYLKAIKENKIYEFKVRESVVDRELYENEFQEIWDKQKEFYKADGIDIDFLPNYDKAISEIVPINNFVERNKWIKKGLGEFIKKYIIYYQRDLKSQTKTISDCRFEENYYKVINKETSEIILKRDGPKVCSQSHPLFQEFRIWQQINNLICRDDNEEELQIDEGLKVELYNYLNEREEATPEQILKFLKKKNPNISSINVVNKWKGNKTLYFFQKIFKKGNYDGNHLLSNHSLYQRLWHLIYSISEEKGIINGLKRIDSNIPDEVIKTFCKADFEEKQYSSMSIKALRNIVPLMRCGSLFSITDLTDKAKGKIDLFLRGELDNVLDPKTLMKLKEKRSIEDFKGLSYYQAASLIYGKHTAKQEEFYNKPDDVLPIPQNSLRNPVVEQIVNETLMLIKELWKKYPDLSESEIRIEFARELKSNKEERKRIAEAQNINRKINQQIVEEIKRHFGENYNPSLTEIEKVKLWKEANMQSAYTGKTLSIAEVLSEYTEVDHIIPKSRYYNDGFVNKVLCESHINSDKGNMTAYEYMNTGTKCQNEKLDYSEFLQFIKRFPYQKRLMLTMKEIPDDFIERQIKETQYIVSKVKQELGKIVGNENVKTTTGTVTDYLKEQWGLSDLMKKLIRPRFEYLEKEFNTSLIHEEEIVDDNGKPTGKKRIRIKGYSKRFDHRHHVIDAVTVACTRQGIIQQLNRLNQITKGKIKAIEETNGESLIKFIPPTGRHDRNANVFYKMVEEAIIDVIISYKNRKRLVSKGVNWYCKYNPEKGKIEKVKQDNSNLWAIKGPLHKETNYGVINFNGQLRYVSRCPLNELKESNIKNIPNSQLKEEIINHINKDEYKGDIKKAFSPEGLIEFNRNRRTPVFSVRVMEEGHVFDVKGKDFLYSKERKLAVEKGGNYCVTVYAHPETEDRKFDVVPFFDAVIFKISGENPFRTDKGIQYEREGYNFLFSLTHYDLVFAPFPEDDLDSINWSDKKFLFNRVYRVQKFDQNGIIYFQPHYYSKEITIHEGKAETSKDYKGEFNKGTNGTEFIIGTRIHIKNVCIKLKIDRLGNISPVL